MNRPILKLLAGYLGFFIALMPAQATESTPPRSIAITTSVTTPFQKVIELSVEYALAPDWSAVIMLGSGADDYGDKGIDTRRLWVGGIQLRYEFLGDFDDGFGLSLLGRYLVLEADKEGFTPQGYAVGPHLYWRIVSSIGLTLDVYVGAVWLWASLHNPDVPQTPARQRPLPSGGLNLGWSFGR